LCQGNQARQNLTADNDSAVHKADECIPQKVRGPLGTLFLNLQIIVFTGFTVPILDTPAIEAGITDHLWEIAELVA
jgi:hypothetical protein